MSTTATHQIPATEASSRLTWAEVGVFAAAGVVVAFAVLFMVQTLAGWFSPSAGTDGICQEYSNQVLVCAPAYSPDGAEMTHMWEDGSAVYSDGHVFGGYSEAGLAVVELDDLDAAEAQSVSERLRSEGWTAVPTDGCECLYAPAGV